MIQVIIMLSKKRSKDLPLSILIVVGVIVLGCLSFSCRSSEIQTNHYETYSDAVEDDAVNRGWIPGIIPSSSFDILEQHNLDTNQVWVRFKLADEDKSSFIDSVEQISSDEITTEIFIVPNKDEWWFDETIIEKNDGGDSSLYQVYMTECEGHSIFDKAYLLSSSVDAYWYYWCAN